MFQNIGGHMSKAKIVIIAMVVIGILSPFGIKFLNKTANSTNTYSNTIGKVTNYSKNEYKSLKNKNIIPQNIENLMDKIMSLI